MTSETWWKRNPSCNSGENGFSRSGDLDKTFELIVQANALVREARVALEATRKVMERKDSWHRVDPRAVAQVVSSRKNLRFPPPRCVAGLCRTADASATRTAANNQSIDREYDDRSDN